MQTFHYLLMMADGAYMALIARMPILAMTTRYTRLHSGSMWAARVKVNGFTNQCQRIGHRLAAGEKESKVMPIISGGTIIPGSKVPIIYTSALPTDAMITAMGITPANGQIAENIANGNLYERQAGAWVRIDTL